MAVLKNRAGVATSTVGTGTITLGTALSSATSPNAAGWQTFGAAGVVNGDRVRYLILDTNGSWEYGEGVYTAVGTTLARATGAMDGSVPGQKSSTNALLALTGGAHVFITAIAEDIGTALISDTPPAAPTNGQLWWESDTGTLWIYYNDGTSSQWVAVGGGGGVAPGLTLLSTVTATAAATVDFTSLLTSAFDEYEVHFSGVRASIDANLFLCRLGQSGVYAATQYFYAGATFTDQQSVAYFGGTAGIGLPLTIPLLVSSNAVNLVSGKMSITAPLSTGFTKIMNFNSAGFNSNGGFNSATGGGTWIGNSNAVDSLRFIMNTGNIFGTFKLYGVR